MAIRSSARFRPGGRSAPAASAVGPKPDNIAAFKSACTNCNLRELCLPCCGLSRSEFELANRLAFNRLRLRRGEALYRTGDSFTSLYAVRKGFFKSVIELADGRRDQVTGFSISGEVLGTDGIGPGRQTCTAVALEDSVVCVIPYAKLQELARQIPSLQHQLRTMMSREIVREQGVMLLLGSMYAEERVAMFLLSMSKRFAAHGHSPSEFNLRMTREEIGSYLGLKLETVSRTFSRFQEEGLIVVKLKFVRILDAAGLERVMGREPG